MLVSSIGYLNAVKSAYNGDLVKVQNAKNSGLNEGFGHDKDYNQSNDTSSNFINNIAMTFVSLFTNSKSDDSHKCLSLIA